MKKNLILFTALFAGTMFISNNICASNILNQNHEQKNAAENLHEEMPTIQIFSPHFENDAVPTMIILDL